jgi:hypothetical protein
VYGEKRHLLNKMVNFTRPLNLKILTQLIFVGNLVELDIFVEKWKVTPDNEL